MESNFFVIPIDFKLETTFDENYFELFYYHNFDQNKNWIFIS